MASPSPPPLRPLATPRATPPPPQEGERTPPPSPQREHDPAHDTPRARIALRRAASSPSEAWTAPSPRPTRALDSQTPPFVPQFAQRPSACRTPFVSSRARAETVPSPLPGGNNTASLAPHHVHSRSAPISSGHGSSSGRAEDPVVALGGRGMPFFMLAPRDEGAPEDEEGGWLDSALDTDKTYRYMMEEAGARGGRSASPSGTSDDFVPLFDIEATKRDERKKGFAGLANGLDGNNEKVNLRELSDVVATLVSRLTSLLGVTNELYGRVLSLEEASLARDGELHALRAALASPSASPKPAMPRRAPPPFPSPFPHAFPDGSYWPPEAAAHPHSTDDLTPPASPVLPRARAPLSRQHSHTTSFGGSSSGASSSSALPTPRDRDRTSSHSSLHFSPLDAPYFTPSTPAPQQECYEPLTPYPTPPALGQFYAGLNGAAPFTFDAGSLGALAPPEMLNEQALFGAGSARRELQGGVSAAGRSVSHAELSCGTGFGGGGGGITMETKQNAFRARSVSLGAPFQPRPLSSQRALDPPNYRVLLETDAEIDHEAFVRRILCSNDQQCSLFLQQRVRGTTPDKRQDLFDAVGRHVLELSVSKFGNFLVSRCLEAGDSALEQAYEDALAGHFLQLSLDSFGCHVVQKLLDCGGPAAKNRVVEELLPHPQVLTTKSSLHVINRILTTPNPPSFFARLAEMGAGLWASIVKDDGGSLVVQHMLEDWPEACTSAVAREILDQLEDVARSACGSFLLDRNTLPFCTKIMQHAPALACDPFGAKLVDKCLRPTRAGPAGVSAFVAAITAGDHPLLVRIAAHAHGAQLLANLLAGPAAPPAAKDALGRCVLANEGALLAAGAAGGGGGARLVVMCRKALVVA
ncbi:meiotic PUF protein 1 [Rhodotorula kratochvilovae]